MIWNLERRTRRYVSNDSKNSDGCSGGENIGNEEFTAEFAFRALHTRRDAHPASGTIRGDEEQAAEAREARP